ncbi:MAG: methyltransferase [Gemmatimonadota bacterium]
MPEQDSAPSDPLPPHVRLVQMSTGFIRSRALHAAAELRLADHLDGGPKTAGELAGATDTHAPALHRLMRALAHWDVLSMEDDGRFSLTPLGEALRSDAPGEARSTILAVVGEAFWEAFRALPGALEDGEPGIQKAMGRSFFEHLEENPEQASHFNDAMIGFHGAEPPAVADAYDFSGFDTIVDVGGGTGNLLTTILGEHPGPDGVLFDLPHVVEEAAELIERRGLDDRISRVPGDFFEQVPEGGDAYVLSHIVHDWPEERCLEILGNCRDAIAPAGRLLIVEMVLPDDGPPHPGYELDMVMLALTGGRERTAGEYADLLAGADFRVERVVPTESPVSVVEAVPA